MAVIDSLIPRQNFELILDRIALIVGDELAQQDYLNNTSDELFLLPDIYVEARTPFDKSMIPAININMAPSTFDNQNAGAADGTFVYNLDFYTKSQEKEDGVSPGDKWAALKRNRLMGMVRVILDNPAYNTLGFAPGFISRVFVREVSFSDTTIQDTVNVTMGRISLSVRSGEYTPLKDAFDITQWGTRVKLALTDKGYKIEYP